MTTHTDNYWKIFRTLTETAGMSLSPGTMEHASSVLDDAGYTVVKLEELNMRPVEPVAAPAPRAKRRKFRVGDVIPEDVVEVVETGDGGDTWKRQEGVNGGWKYVVDKAMTDGKYLLSISTWTTEDMLSAYGPVKEVRQPAAAPAQPAEVQPALVLRDADRDRWYLRDNGKYGLQGQATGSSTRAQVEQLYGPVTEVVTV